MIRIATEEIVKLEVRGGYEDKLPISNGASRPLLRPANGRNNSDFISACLHVVSAYGVAPVLTARIQMSWDNTTWEDVPGGIFQPVAGNERMRPKDEYIIQCPIAGRFIRAFWEFAGHEVKFNFGITADFYARTE
ncbi:MAG: hypothetical protein L0Y74_08095 [candidate division Zixibacteria bacterium]|nr:hypothetical protein [candidate division Zixibacteria bacterium]